MIHIIEGLGEAGQQALLDAMFEARKRLFVDLLDDRIEIDRFDDAFATYFIIADNAGRHLASLRLLPSTRPHLLGLMFERLCPDGVPIGPDIFEITRLCLPPTETKSERRRCATGSFRQRSSMGLPTASGSSSVS